MSAVKDKKPFISGLVEGQIDVQVYQDILRNYAKETISMPMFGNFSITNINSQQIARVEFTETEISPFHYHQVSCQDLNSENERQSSFTKFKQQKMPFDFLRQFLVNCFSPNSGGHRPYPSAGGLYPVEPLVFVFDEQLETHAEIVSGCYHYRAISHKLQLIKKMDADYFFQNLLQGLIKKENRPAFVILYVAHLGKSIFKYRYRGYRQAAMEAGSMYQHCTEVAEKAGFRTTAWSSFSEPQMLAALDLDHGTFLPMTIQLFGYGDKS